SLAQPLAISRDTVMRSERPHLETVTKQQRVGRPVSEIAEESRDPREAFAGHGFARNLARELSVVVALRIDESAQHRPGVSGEPAYIQNRKRLRSIAWPVKFIMIWTRLIHPRLGEVTIPDLLNHLSGDGEQI